MNKKFNQWRFYFNTLFKKGYSKEKIKKELLEKGYDAEDVDFLLNAYSQEKKIKLISFFGSASFFLLVLFVIFTYPAFTGKVVSIIGLGTNKIYYVDIVNGNNANNGLSQLNAFQTLEYAFLQLGSGDILYVMDGTYYLNSSLSLSNAYFDAAVMVSAFNQGIPLVKANIPIFENPTLDTWQNVSENGLNIWSSSFSASDSTFIAYYNDTKINLFSYNKLSDFMNISKPEGIFYNISNQKLLIRFKDINKNPNTVSLIISNRIPFYFTNVKGKGFIISGLNIEGASKCIFITGSDNILLQNNTCLNALKGFDIRGTSNVSILNNVIYMKPGDFSWKDMKLSLMETSALYLQDNLEDVNASYNEIFGYFNGILTYSTGLGKFFNIDVSYNNIYEIYDDAIEIEDFCNKGRYHHNTISDAFVGFSLSPAQAQQNKCYIHNNLIIADKLVRWDNSGNYYKGECFKIIDDSPAGFMEYFQNTCIGRGIYTTTANTRTQINSTWLYNIFYSQNQKLIQKSGLSSDGIFFDSNIYFRQDGGTIFQYWNSDTISTEFSTLNAAKQSNLWDGNWDINSLNLNPMFSDLDSGDYSLKAESPACNINGNYAGAFPCNSPNIENPLNINHQPMHLKPVLITSNLLNSTNENLICLNQSTYDADNDSVINKIRWFKNYNEVVLFENSSEIDSQYTEIDDAWQCEITPFDGKEYGENLSSNLLYILPLPVCNDGICSENENCINCQTDCGICNISSCNLDDQFWNEDQALSNAFNLNNCFYDPLNETSAYGFEWKTNFSNISVSINNGFVSFIPDKNWYGVAEIRFFAYSNNRTANTNYISLNVFSLPDCGDTICEPGETCRDCSSDCGQCSANQKSSGRVINLITKNNTNDKTNQKKQATKEASNASIENKEPLFEKPIEIEKDEKTSNVVISENYSENNIFKKQTNNGWLFILQGFLIIALSFILVRLNLRKKIMLKKASKPFVKENIFANNLYDLALHIYNMPHETFAVLKDDISDWVNNSLDAPHVAKLLEDSQTKDETYRILYELYEKEK